MIAESRVPIRRKGIVSKARPARVVMKVDEAPLSQAANWGIGTWPRPAYWDLPNETYAILGSLQANPYKEASRSPFALRANGIICKAHYYRATKDARPRRTESRLARRIRSPVKFPERQRLQDGRRAGAGA